MFTYQSLQRGIDVLLSAVTAYLGESNEIKTGIAGVGDGVFHIAICARRWLSLQQRRLHHYRWSWRRNRPLWDQQ